MRGHGRLPRDRVARYEVLRKRMAKDGETMAAMRRGMMKQRGQGMAPVTVVCGPPGSGKTTWVRDHAERGDLILDLDTLAQAVTGLDLYDKPDELLPYVWDARDAMLTRLAAYGDVPAWIIMMGARAAERSEMRDRFDAEIVVLETPGAECIRRLTNDPARAGDLEEWGELVVRWWSEYEPDERDTVVRELSDGA